MGPTRTPTRTSSPTSARGSSRGCLLFTAVYGTALLNISYNFDACAPRSCVFLCLSDCHYMITVMLVSLSRAASLDGRLPILVAFRYILLIHNNMLFGSLGKYTFTKLHDRHIPNIGVGIRVGVGPMEFQLNTIT